MKSLQDTARRKTHFFGADVYNTAYDVKQRVTNTMNPLYVAPEDLRSGETPSAMLQAIRKAVYTPDALSRAKRSVSAKVVRLKKAGKLPSDFIEDIEIKKRFDEIIATFDPDEWFPNYWLSFVLLSLPAGDRCIDSFQTVNAARIQQEFISTAAAERERTRPSMGRSERRLGDRLAVAARYENQLRAESPANTAGRGTPDSAISHNHTIRFEGGKRSRNSECTDEENNIKVKHARFKYLMDQYTFFSSIGKQDLAEAVLSQISKCTTSP